MSPTQEKRFDTDLKNLASLKLKRDGVKVIDVDLSEEREKEKAAEALEGKSQSESSEKTADPKTEIKVKKPGEKNSSNPEEISLDKAKPLKPESALTSTGNSPEALTFAKSNVAHDAFRKQFLQDLESQKRSVSPIAPNPLTGAMEMESAKQRVSAANNSKEAYQYHLKNLANVFDSGSEVIQKLFRKIIPAAPDPANLAKYANPSVEKSSNETWQHSKVRVPDSQQKATEPVQEKSSLAASAYHALKSGVEAILHFRKSEEKVVLTAKPEEPQMAKREVALPREAASKPQNAQPESQDAYKAQAKPAVLNKPEEFKPLEVNAPPKPKAENVLELVKRDLQSSIKSYFAETTEVISARVNKAIDNSAELKRFAESIETRDLRSTELARAQLKNSMNEAVRMTVSRAALQLAPENVNALVSDVASKLGALYGVSLIKPDVAPSAQPSYSQDRPAPEHFSSRQHEPRDQGSPSTEKTLSSGGQMGNEGSYQGGSPRSTSASTAPSFGRDEERELYNRKERDAKLKEEETRDKEEREGKEDRKINPEHFDPDQIRRIKEAKNLKVQYVYTISGVVSDKFSGRGVAGVYVNGGLLGMCLTNRAGEFSFENVPERRVYTLIFKKQGYDFSPSSLTDTADGPNRHNIYAKRKR